MATIYNEGLEQEQIGNPFLTESTAQENADEQVGSQPQTIEVIVEEESEIKESTVTSTEVYFKEEPFSIVRFFGRLSVNLVLPFINGLMLGFGEIIAHEIGFHYNWTGSRVYPQRRMIEKKSKLL